MNNYQSFTTIFFETNYFGKREFDKIRKQQEVEPAILLALNPKMVYSANSSKQLIQPLDSLENSKYFDVLNARFERYF